jgi:hypothetical protein
VKKFRVGISVAFLRARQIRAAAAASRPQSMAKSTIRAKLKLAEFGSLWIVGERICVLCEKSGVHATEKERGNKRQHEAARND